MSTTASARSAPTTAAHEPPPPRRPSSSGGSDRARVALALAPHPERPLAAGFAAAPNRRHAARAQSGLGAGFLGFAGEHPEDLADQAGLGGLAHSEIAVACHRFALLCIEPGKLPWGSPRR